jgi:hypothetical protein
MTDPGRDEHAQRHEMPPDPQTRPEDAVDALEEELFGDATHQTRDEDDTDEPAFEQDIDTDDPQTDGEPDEPSG